MLRIIVIALCSLGLAACEHSVGSHAVQFSGTNVTFSKASPARVSNGDTFSITVIPDANYALPRSAGGTCPAGTFSDTVYTTGVIRASCSLTFAGTRAAVISFTVSASADANGTISPSGATTVALGASETFTAAPNADDMVAEWVLDGTSVQTGGTTYTLSNVSADHTLKVAFSIKTFDLIATVSGGHGAVAPASVIVQSGATAGFTATPDAGYEVASWSLDGNSVQTGGTIYTLSNVSANHTLKVTFSIETFNLIATVSGGHGAVAPGSVNVQLGTTAGFTATPNAGYEVATWSLDGTSVQTGGTTYSIANVTAAHTLVVTFARKPRFAYVVNGDGTNFNVMVCAIGSDGVSLITCTNTNLDATAYPNFTYPQGIALNPAGTIAYVTTYDNGLTASTDVWECSVNSADGTFSTCAPFAVTAPSSFSYSAYGMIALNSAGTSAYIVDYYGNDVIVCPLGINGTFSSSVCASAGVTTLSSPVGIALNPAGNTVYIANTGGGVTVCQVSESSFTGCIDKSGDGSISFNSVYGLAVAPDGSSLYLTEPYSNNVYVCSTTSNNTPTFESCNNAIGANAFNTPYGIVVNARGTIAYVTSYADPGAVYICPINAAGTFDTCTMRAGFVYAPGIGLGY